MSFLTRPTSLSVLPTYLLPSVSFRRRKSSTDSTESDISTTSITSLPAVDGALPERYLSGHTSHLRCARCAADLCLTSQIISKGFTGRHGRAYLVSASTFASGISLTSTASSSASLPNTHIHKAVPRQLVTGAHTVSDISCAFCGQVLGWKYVAAEEESQRYKVGKFILETRKTCSSSRWENEDLEDADWDETLQAPPISLSIPTQARGREEGIEFDSQDEDECEDLFAGVWSPALAIKRRQGKRFGPGPAHPFQYGNLR